MAKLEECSLRAMISGLSIEHTPEVTFPEESHQKINKKYFLRGGRLSTIILSMYKSKKSRRDRKRLRNEDSISRTKSPKRARTEENPRSSDLGDAGGAVLARILGVAAFVLPLFFMKKKQREQRTSDSASNVATEPEEPAPFIDTSQLDKPLTEMSEAELSKLASSELELGMDGSRGGSRYVDNEKQFAWELHAAGLEYSTIAQAVRRTVSSISSVIAARKNG
eukprot:186324_1